MALIKKILDGIKVYFDARPNIFHLVRDAKWLILLSVLLSVVLWLPDQTRELYRMVVADITLVNPTLEDARFVLTVILKLTLPLILISAFVWFGVYQVMTDSLERLTRPPSPPLSPQAKRVAELLPLGCGALPLLACVIGQIAAIPYWSTNDAAAQLVAGPWDDFARDQSNTVGLGLIVGSFLLLLITVALIVIGWQLRSTLRGLSTRLNEGYFSSNRFLLITIFLLLLTALAFYQFPVKLPQVVGVFGIAALFTLCTVAFCVHFALLTAKYQFPFISSILVVALLIALFDLNDNHDIRALDATPTQPVSTAAEQFEKWYESRLPALATYDEFPVYVVAAQGGGIYAAYQTAIFLARMYDYCPAFNDHLFAISSVSGGSLGAAAYVAALKSLDNNKPPASDPTQKSTLPPVSTASDPCPAITQYLSGERPVIPSNLELPGPLEIRMRKLFASDFLSPVIGRAMFTDYTQSFLPYPIDGFDRARALEFALRHSIRTTKAIWRKISHRCGRQMEKRRPCSSTQQTPAVGDAFSSLRLS